MLKHYRRMKRIGGQFQFPDKTSHHNISPNPETEARFVIKIVWPLWNLTGVPKHLSYFNEKNISNHEYSGFEPPGALNVKLS